MDDLFNMLSASARIDKSKRTKKRQRQTPTVAQLPASIQSHVIKHNKDNDDDDIRTDDKKKQLASRDRTGKRDTSEAKLQQIHKEQIAAFRRSMCIRLGNKHDPHVPDPVSSFGDLSVPKWWDNARESQFQNGLRALNQNIEHGRWKEPTPIQMQGMPTLLERRDLIGCAPTGSGKSGAFVIPSLLLSCAPHDVFYASQQGNNGGDDMSSKNNNKKSKKKKATQSKESHQGEIRSLLVAPSRELAAQLHREVERLGIGKPGGLTSALLSKSNAANIVAGNAGGKHGLDVLVTTPLRLVDSLEKGLDLTALRIIILDEADRLLDAKDGMMSSSKQSLKKEPDTERGSDSESSSSDEESDEETPKKKAQHMKKKGNEQKHSNASGMPSSGSSQTQSFLLQMDIIFSALPTTATRALFSATVTPTVRSLAESILRNPVDVTIAAPGTTGGANLDIDQELMFVGREEGKLLAIRQLAQRGQLKPPTIIFVQSKERAQALFGELLYDGIHIDVIHAGRSRSARDNAVAKFRRGDTWVLICTDLVARGVDFRAVNMVINYDLPASGITYVHRIGRTGRAGRKGKAITLFTEADFDNLRTIANVMKQSGCDVPDWMLNLKRNKRPAANPRRPKIDTTPNYDKVKRLNRKQSIQSSKKRKEDSGPESVRPKKKSKNNTSHAK